MTKAVELIVSFDPEVMKIAGRSLSISVTSTFLASIIFIPLGTLIHFKRFPGKKAVISVVQTFYSTPTVAVGLLIFVLFSRAGPLGGLEILFTPTAMVLGQMVLVSPILVGLTISALNGVDRTITDTAISLGASGVQTAIVVIKEARFAVLAAAIMAFGRAISEVGIALMVGGNIRDFTRVITTAIALESSKGDVELAMALGMILLLIALPINIILYRIQHR